MRFLEQKIFYLQEKKTRREPKLTTPNVKSKNKKNIVNVWWRW